MNIKRPRLLTILLLSFLVCLGCKVMYNHKDTIGKTYESIVSYELRDETKYAMVIHQAKLGSQYPPLRLYHTRYENNYLNNLIKLHPNDSIYTQTLEIMKNY